MNQAYFDNRSRSDLAPILETLSGFSQYCRYISPGGRPVVLGNPSYRFRRVPSAYHVPDLTVTSPVKCTIRRHNHDISNADVLRKSPTKKMMSPSSSGRRKVGFPKFPQYSSKLIPMLVWMFVLTRQGAMFNTLTLFFPSANCRLSEMHRTACLLAC